MDKFVDSYYILALAQKYRLSKKVFDRVFKTGKTVRGGFFFVRFKSNDLGYGRAAVVVPSKVSKKSVVRNRIKRIMSEIVRGSGLLKKSTDFVFVILTNIVEVPFGEVKKEIERTSELIGD